MEQITDQLLAVIRTVKQIEIQDLDDSMFCSRYALEPNDLVYLLLLASEQIGFSITEELIDFLEEHNSFRELIDYISRHRQERV